MINYNNNLDPRDLFYINENGLVCQEEWRDVLNYEGTYKISNLGRRKNKLGKICRQRIKKEYNTARLCKNNIYQEFLTHRLVAMAFIPNPENKPEVNHKDENGTKWYNVVWNLEWATKSENAIHRHKNGLQKPIVGSDSNFAKLTEKQVLEIKELYSSGKYSQTKISEIYNVRQTCVSKIINGQRWKHLL